MTEMQREFGRLEAQVSILISRFDKMEKKVDCINTTLSEAKGGWRVMLMIAGLSATVGGIVSKVLPWLMSGPK